MGFAIGCSLFITHSALAESAGSVETLAQALASAYTDNPTLNAQRASLRATDEGVPQALSGYRPTVSAGASAGITDSPSGTNYPRGVSLTITQPLFTGFRTTNGTKIAETAVLAAREMLRDTEQTTLLNAVEAFMNLVQAQAILNLQKQNVDFLGQQGKAATDRLNVGEGTKTDVAQTDASLAAGQASYKLGRGLAEHGDRRVRAGDRPPAEKPRYCQAGREPAFEEPQRGARRRDDAASGNPGRELQHRHLRLQREGRGRRAAADRVAAGVAVP
ncbi:MAG: TolC family protein [Bauldia sp.]